MVTPQMSSLLLILSQLSIEGCQPRGPAVIETASISSTATVVTTLLSATYICRIYNYWCVRKWLVSGSRSIYKSPVRATEVEEHDVWVTSATSYASHCSRFTNEEHRRWTRCPDAYFLSRFSYLTSYTGSFTHSGDLVHNPIDSSFISTSTISSWSRERERERENSGRKLITVCYMR